MPKIKKILDNKAPSIVKAKTKSDPSAPLAASQWWKAPSKDQRAIEAIATANFLKDSQQYRYRQAGTYTRLYSNMPLFGALGGGMNRLVNTNAMPSDRPTMNVVQSCVDTLVSRITQARPKPTFLTDNGDYKTRKLAKQLNEFSAGELYQTKAYELMSTILRDASAGMGTGCIKVYEDQKNRVALERVLATELYVDPNDAMYGNPRQLVQLKLVDREVALEMFPESKSKVLNASRAYPDSSADSSKSISDQIMLAETWHLPSGPESKDGLHLIACEGGSLFEEDYTKDRFPFVFLHYNPRMLGFWGQSLAEQLMGTQVEINKLLITISKSINLVGVPRIFVEAGSKVNKAAFNNDIGTIIPYQGTKPEYEVAQCVPAEVYAQLQRLIEYAYQQSGISSLAATSQKPSGLDSGQALREYDDLQSDRFARLNKCYDNCFIDLVYLITDKAKDIAVRDGSYSTVYPNKNGTKEIDLPAAELDDPFVIQCFDASALPRDPAGRLQKITEMIQSGMVSMSEGRRLLDYPDLEQNEKLANSGEERILQILDEIVEEGQYTPPDPFMDAQLAIMLSRQYYNLYVAAKLEEDRAEMLRTFNAQAVMLVQAAQPPAPQPGPQAMPQPLPQSPLVPNALPQ